MECEDNIHNADIIFIYPPYHSRIGSGTIPSVGLAFLTSYLNKKGFSSKIIECNLSFCSQEEKSLKSFALWLDLKFQKIKPNLAIGIGPCTTSSIRSIAIIAKLCKTNFPTIPIIYGGPLTLIPRMEHLFFKKLNAFAMIKGDGELPLTEILTCLKEESAIHHIPGVQLSSDVNVNPFFLENLDLLPYPEWIKENIPLYIPSTRRDLNTYPVLPIIGSRGCCYNCDFCISGQYIKYRRHSFEYIAKQVQYLQQKYGIQSVIFYDDGLFPKIQEVNAEMKSFSTLLHQYSPSILWQMEIRPDVFSSISNDTLSTIYSNGCRQMNIGIEKASIFKHYSNSFTMEIFKGRCLELSHSHSKIRLSGTFILGGPGETVEDIRKTIQYSTELNLLFAHFYPLELYPGTPLYQKLFGDNPQHWYTKIMKDKYPWGELIFESEEIGLEQLLDMIQIAYKTFYQRKEWKDLAKQHLGYQYEKVVSEISEWQENRFNLKRQET